MVLAINQLPFCVPQLQVVNIPYLSALILCSNLIFFKLNFKVSVSQVPKAAPKMNVDIISSTKLNVSWEPLSKKESRGVVVEYKLQWRLHQHPYSRILYLPATIEYYILMGIYLVLIFY